MFFSISYGPARTGRPAPGADGMEPLYRLFNPRKQSRKRHFRWDNAVLVGKTFSGKVTVQIFNINNGTTARSR